MEIEVNPLYYRLIIRDHVDERSLNFEKIVKAAFEKELKLLYGEPINVRMIEANVDRRNANLTYFKPENGNTDAGYVSITVVIVKYEFY